jgi:hypothetical protein
MTPDRIMVASGLIAMPEGFTDEARSVLVSAALRMRLAGVVLTLTEWESLSMETQSAFIAAGKVLHEHLAVSTPSEVPAVSP